ncbi:hypothetical protein OIV83_003640 [Microbotryomycetes sp. JL201]|nr:hypothetical protein OIV83_003640 [Microbotryomycetes sp. JL201]
MLRGGRNTILSKNKEEPVTDIYQCFYNTVLQALAVSQPLSEIIMRAPESSPALRRLSPASPEYDPDPATLPSPLPITQALLNLLKNLDLSNDTSRGRKVLNPKALLRYMSVKHEEYAQATQQDAHEMLRHLIDGVMMEEVDLIKKVDKHVRTRPPPQSRTATLRAFVNGEDMRTPTGENPSRKKDADQVVATSSESDSSSSSEDDSDEDDKNASAASGQMKPFIADVFDGKLASIVICSECKHGKTEDFMDISLSLRDDAGNKTKRRDRIRKMFGKRSSSPGSSSKSNESSANESGRPYFSLSETEASSSASELESDDDRKPRSRQESIDPQRLSGKSWLGGRSASRAREASPLGRSGSLLSSSASESKSSSSRKSKPKIPRPTAEQVAYIRRLLVEIPAPSKDPLPIRIARPPGSAAPSADSSSSSIPSLTNSMASLRVSSEQMSTDLYECLRQFTSVEVLEGDNSFACHNCWKLLNPDLVEKRKQEKAQKRAEKHRKRSLTLTTDLASEGGLQRRDSLAPSDSASNTMPLSPAGSSQLSLDSEPSDVSTRDEERAAFADVEDGSATDLSINSDSNMSTGLVREPLTTANIEKLAESNDITPSASRAQSRAHSVSDASASNTSGVVVNTVAVSTTPSKATSTSTDASRKPETKAPPKARYILRKAHKRYLISAPDLPPVLVIHLKRFQQTNKSSLFGAPFTSLKKRDDALTFPQELDLSPFLAPTGKAPMRKAPANGTTDAKGQSGPVLPEVAVGDARYSLYAVVVHFGTLVTGHYSAYVKSDRYGKGPGGTSDRRWFFCSDEDVRACSLDEVLRSKAYILFYERVAHESAQDEGVDSPYKSQL